MQIKYETTIEAPRDHVWKILNDFGNIENFHPFVLESHSLSDAAGGLGATRRCDFGKGVAVSERIVGWSDGESMDIDIYKREGMPSVVKSMTARFELSDAGDATRVVGSLSIEIGPKVVAVLMGPIMNRQMTKALRGLLAGMKRHAETQDLVNVESDVDIDAVVAVA